MSGARFGPAGRPDSFTQMGFKKTEELPDYLREFTLDAFEYQCGRGVRIQEEAMAKLGLKAREFDIALSVHAPYYISLSSLDEEKRLRSIDYLLDTAKAARLMGADRIVVHTGSCGKLPREEALSLASDTLGLALSELARQGYGDITLCPETMGKVNQLGSLQEVLVLCTAYEQLLPCIDFGHLYARSFGGIKGADDYREILNALEKTLGVERASRFHSHFSRIAFTEKGGEKVHLTFADTLYGPEYEPLMELIGKKGWNPRFICESAGTQAEDARSMRSSYLAYGVS